MKIKILLGIILMFLLATDVTNSDVLASQEPGTGGGYVCPSEYLSTANSVDSGLNIHWDEDSIFDTYIDYSFDKWNEEDVINFQEDTIFTAKDLDIEDKYEPGETWAGRYSYTVDTIWLNSAKMITYNTTEKRNVIMHEIGHSVGLNHMMYNQIMYYLVTSVDELQYYEQVCYQTRWE